MVFQRENQRISASEVLQEIANGEDIRFYKCTISGELDVNRFFVKSEAFDTSKLKLETVNDKHKLTLSQMLVFNSCVFEDNVCFSAPWDNPEGLEVIFEQDVAFNSSVFDGQGRFSSAVFGGSASFDGCTFNRIASFKDAVHKGPAFFRTVAFNGYGPFNGANFENEARFTNTCFGRGGNFTGVKFGGRTDFSGVYSKSKSIPVYESVWFARRRHGDDETFWRFIKQASQEAGYYQLAGESFYNERCASLWRRFRGSNYDNLSSLQKTGRMIAGVKLLPELVFGRLLFGYGERPVRVLVASALIILICALFYASPYAAIAYRGDALTDSHELAEGWYLSDGLYFSTITFTTLGFGDMYPVRESELTRVVAMIESLSGACLMALFVVSLAKRFSRN